MELSVSRVDLASGVRIVLQRSLVPAVLKDP